MGMGVPRHRGQPLVRIAGGTSRALAWCVRCGRRCGSTRFRRRSSLLLSLA